MPGHSIQGTGCRSWSPVVLVVAATSRIRDWESPWKPPSHIFRGATTTDGPDVLSRTKNALRRRGICFDRRLQGWQICQ